MRAGCWLESGFLDADWADSCPQPLTQGGAGAVLGTTPMGHGLTPGLDGYIPLISFESQLLISALNLVGLGIA